MLVLKNTGFIVLNCSAGDASCDRTCGGSMISTWDSWGRSTGESIDSWEQPGGRSTPRPQCVLGELTTVGLLELPRLVLRSTAIRIAPMSFSVAGVA